ncbi:hypothetical protein BDP27DRAFT_1329607 [Rhodocollybia butyracea]|uniref:Uncharacterized protein n=1 Tax=Rhodocollybia butyracea TaxID=206335 RepID=A0A9P5PPH5_9AGAR|nr:hypothetical protein BDP27DRAFT_1329607 [Rhodocollybia butyracea]
MELRCSIPMSIPKQPTLPLSLSRINVSTSTHPHHRNAHSTIPIPKSIPNALNLPTTRLPPLALPDPPSRFTSFRYLDTTHRRLLESSDLSGLADLSDRATYTPPPESDNTMTDSDTGFSSSSSSDSSPSPSRSPDPSSGPGRSHSPSCSPSSSRSPSRSLSPGPSSDPAPPMSLSSSATAPSRLTQILDLHSTSAPTYTTPPAPARDPASLYCRHVADDAAAHVDWKSDWTLDMGFCSGFKFVDSDMNVDFDMDMDLAMGLDLDLDTRLGRPQRYNVQIDVDMGMRVGVATGGTGIGMGTGMGIDGGMGWDTDTLEHRALLTRLKIKWEAREGWLMREEAYVRVQCDARAGGSGGA